MNTVIIVVLCVHAVNAAILLIADLCDRNPESYVWFTCFTILLPLYVLSYPIRMWKAYNESIGFYRKHGISRLQYIFGSLNKLINVRLDGGD